MSKQEPNRNFFKIIFGRTAVIMLLLLIQAAAAVLYVYWLRQYAAFVYSIMLILSFPIIILILNDKTEPTFQLAWMTLMVVSPVFGALFYAYVRLSIGTKMINRRLERIIYETRSYLGQDQEVKASLEADNPLVARFSDYMFYYAGYPIYRNTEAKYFPLGDYAFDEMKKQLEMAKDFIFLEFFIIKKGKMWGEILEILERKVKEGVEVRLLYDGTCAFSLLPHNYPKLLEEKGIHCKVFSPIRPALSTYQNNRDHRKILVVDGRVAFTGGINLADEYINEVSRFGHWKDTAVMIWGDAVKSFTQMFLQMWDISEKKLDDFARYSVRDPEKRPKETDGHILPYSDSPLDKERVGEEVYLNIVHTSSRYVHIMTPYLILDYETVDTLRHAAKKGLDVKIIMPHVPDKWYAFLVAKTYYEELITAGVQIYEYTPGFVHAKVFVADDVKAAVGTVNLDFRSLYLHFECGVYMYKNEAVRDVEEDFQRTLRSCQKITIKDCRRLAWHRKVIGKVLRIMAPLM